MDLSEKADLVWLSRLTRDLRIAAPRYDPLLVGAMARDLLLHYGHEVEIARATADVDLAIAMTDWEEFAGLRASLIDSGTFTQTRNVHRLCHRGGMPVDLIPFGEIEYPIGSITWPGNQHVMGVLGFREAYGTALEMALPESQHILTVSLAMLAILKLLAWSERHAESPRKDAGDLFMILKNYLNRENTRRLYEEAAHLLDAEDFDHEAAGAWLAGYDASRQIAAFGTKSRKILGDCQSILDVQTNTDASLKLVAESGVEVSHAVRLLQGFRDGIRFGVILGETHAD